jgi:hypothetical protein
MVVCQELGALPNKTVSLSRYCNVRTCRHAAIKDSKSWIRLVVYPVGFSNVSHFGDTNGVLYMEIPALQDIDCAYNGRKTCQ